MGSVCTQRRFKKDLSSKKKDVRDYGIKLELLCKMQLYRIGYYEK